MTLDTLIAPTINGDRMVRSPENKSLVGTIMIVDDEPINIKVAQKYLRQAGYERFITTQDSRQAMELIRGEHPDLVILDIMMPHVSGLHILEAVRSDIQLHHLPVLILTAAADEETKFRALDLGATDFLNKPVKSADLLPRVRNSLLLKAHIDQQAEYSSRLELEVRQRTADLAKSRKELVHVLACAAEHRDQETGNHVVRVGSYAGLIARQLGMNELRVELIEQAAILHDVGKLGISDTILLKSGRLTPQEFATMQRHCEFGSNILQAKPISAGQRETIQGPPGAISSPILQIAAIIAASHHEKWDGSGYPAGLRGEAIPLEARITAVADVFDALSSQRPYKQALPYPECFAILEQGRAKHFDPQVLDAFFARREEVLAIAAELADTFELPPSTN